MFSCFFCVFLSKFQQRFAVFFFNHHFSRFNFRQLVNTSSLLVHSLKLCVSHTFFLVRFSVNLFLFLAPSTTLSAGPCVNSIFANVFKKMFTFTFLFVRGGIIVFNVFCSLIFAIELIHICVNQRCI